MRMDLRPSPAHGPAHGATEPLGRWPLPSEGRLHRTRASVQSTAQDRRSGGFAGGASDDLRRRSRLVSGQFPVRIGRSSAVNRPILPPGSRVDAAPPLPWERDGGTRGQDEQSELLWHPLEQAATLQATGSGPVLFLAAFRSCQADDHGRDSDTNPAAPH